VVTALTAREPRLHMRMVTTRKFKHVCAVVTGRYCRVSWSFTGGACSPVLRLWCSNIIKQHNLTTAGQWTHAYCIKTIAPCVPLTYLLSEMKMLCCQLHSSVYAAVRISNCLKINYCNQSSHYENYRKFLLQMKPSRAYHKIDTFHGEQRWMGHKRGHC